MGRAFKRLERVLELESSQGYQNKAVVGGIRQFAMFWVEQAREEAQDDADGVLVEQVAEVLTNYGRLPGIEARKKAIGSLLESLRRRDSRVSAQKQEPVRPPQRQVERKPERQASAPPPRREAPPPPVEERRPPAESLPEAKSIESTDNLLPGERKRAVPVARPQAEADAEGLAQSVTTLKGVGPKIEELLARLGAKSIGELLYVFPRRYDDYTLMKPIKDLEYGEQVTIIGTVWETRARRTRNNQVMVQSVISDGTAKVQVTWFNQKWLVDKLKSGMQIVISGKVEQYLGRLVFNSPDWEPLELEPLRTRRVVPVYPLTQGLSSNKMRDVMRKAVSKWSPRVPEILPESVRQRRQLYSLPQAIFHVHFPDSQESLHQARKRLVFDELFLLQLGMRGQRRDWQSHPSRPVPSNPATLISLQNELPFELTAAQKRVIDEILTDMAGEVPMNRLLQGDVGSGKTVVAAAALMAATSRGMQAALMAPTEILAEQHFSGLSKMLASQPVELRLLTGSTSAADKERIYREIGDGTAQIVVGTHALIQESVSFKNLALAVIDEQHRFGVDQRRALRDKGMDGLYPHLLVMSATPIPRTLALSLYGDLDISIIDEMPAGRQEIKTKWMRHSERERGYSFVRGQIEQGRQAFIIYPLVEESDKIDAKAAVEEYERLQTAIFTDLKLGLIHGRMKSDEKEAAMRAFHAGETDILVATSVIEVGVDVPNSTVMLIEGANRFGLAQLHQFRGRVGRGEHQSYCLLFAGEESGDSEARLQALEQTNDGFVLAEKDLELRGPGEFFGRRQSGLPELQLASLLDMEMLEIACEEAIAVLDEDPLLELPEHHWLKLRMAQFWDKAGDAS